MAGESIAFSRTIYKMMRRETGCPPVIAIKQTPAHWGWYVEMKDGSFSMEIDSSQVSDVWEAKCKCIEGWEALKENS